MPEPTVKEITVGHRIGGSVQIVKYEYTESYSTSMDITYAGEWTEEEAMDFRKQKREEIRAIVEEEAQAEVDRLNRMYAEANGLEAD